MIMTTEGPYGSGKTLFAVMMSHGYFRRGWKVTSNIMLNFPHTPLDMGAVYRLDESIHDTVLLVDEGHYWFDARRSASNNNLAWSNFQDESRKRNLIVLIAVHSLRKVDWRVRDAIDIRTRCYFDKKNAILTVRMFDVRDGTFHRPRRYQATPFFKLYNTYQRVHRPKGLERLAGAV